jgi:hypothetical protein
MFWKRKTGTSEPKSALPKPKFIPDIVGGHLVVDYQQNPDWVWKLKCVVRKRQDSRSAFDIRIFDEVEAATSNIKIVDYNSFDEHPELLLYEGWYDNEARTLEVEEKKKA